MENGRATAIDSMERWALPSVGPLSCCRGPNVTRRCLSTGLLTVQNASSVLCGDAPDLRHFGLMTPFSALAEAAYCEPALNPNPNPNPNARAYIRSSVLYAARLEVAELARMTDSALSLAAAPAPPLVFSEAEDEAAPADRQAWAQVWGLFCIRCIHMKCLPCRGGGGGIKYKRQLLHLAEHRKGVGARECETTHTYSLHASEWLYAK